MTFSVLHALGSRRRVLLWTLIVLMLLDLGRSLYAPWGYAKPIAVWQPSPSTYADIAWPPGSDLPATASRGAALYARQRRCAAIAHSEGNRGRSRHRSNGEGSAVVSQEVVPAFPPLLFEGKTFIAEVSPMWVTMYIERQDRSDCELLLAHSACYQDLGVPAPHHTRH